MTLGLIVRRRLRQHALSTAVSAGAVALAGGFLMAVWVVKDQALAAFTAVDAGFDAVLGARGSKLQLVLNAVFHLDESPGNLAWADYLELQAQPSVERAIPLAAGDNYRGFRVVGVTTNLFGDAAAAPDRGFRVRPPGRVFDPTRREAVVGSFAAQRLGLRPGDRFQPYHGLIFNPADQHAESYVVVGVLEPSNTPADRVVWIPLKGVQRMAGHDPRAADELSAVLVRFRGASALAGRQLELRYNREESRLTFAWPIAQIIARLFDRIAWFDRVLTLVANLVALLAASSILAGIHNAMNERRRDIAILRALGAHRRTVFGAVVLEAAGIAALGVLPGYVVHGAITVAAAYVIRAQTGVVLDPWAFHPVLVLAPLAMVTLGALVGLVPATAAYRTEVAAHLTPQA